MEEIADEKIDFVIKWVLELEGTESTMEADLKEFAQHELVQYDPSMIAYFSMVYGLIYRRELLELLTKMFYLEKAIREADDGIGTEEK